MFNNVDIFNKKESTKESPDYVGNTSLWDEDNNRFKFTYFAPIDLHPYYRKLVEENEQTLLREAQKREGGFEVTDRFREKAEQLYREGMTEDGES